MGETVQVTPEEYAGAVTRVEEIAAACHAADGSDPLDEAARLHLHRVPPTGPALHLAPGGFAQVRLLAGRTQLDLAVAPGQRRSGVASRLLDAALAGVSGEVLAWSHVGHPGAAALAARRGFVRERELLVLQRTLDASSLDGAADPRIRAWTPADTAELLRVNAAAFAHHPEQGALDEAGVAERMAEPWFDPAGLLVADGPDGRLLGFHWTKVHRSGSGEVYVLGIDPAAQGLGLGRALTRAGLAHLATRGCARVHLYVEASNAAARALYVGQGFTLHHTHVQYRRPAL